MQLVDEPRSMASTLLTCDPLAGFLVETTDDTAIDADRQPPCENPVSEAFQVRKYGLDQEVAENRPGS